jgi:predicted transcriptional regulator
MSRETDWHVFDKACEITAMAARGTADQVSAPQVADIFRQVHTALKETADAMEASKPAGF